MKLTTLLLIIALVQASAAGYSQVTLKEKNAPLEKILNSIEKQAKVNFFYNIKDIKDAKVNIQVNNATLKETLDQCLANLQLTYEIKENTVFLSKKEPSFLDKLEETVKEIISNIDVNGRVLDEQGLPIASATVTVKGTTNSTITDEKGYFTLKNVDSKAIIIVSVIGYEKKEISAQANVGDVKLVVAENKLDQVQVIAYGQTSQRLTVGNIAKVSSEEIEKQPVTNPLLTLEGRVPGVFITQASGWSGSNVTVRIQGQNSIGGGNDPFYIVDGVPFYQSLGSLGISSGFSPINTPSPFSYLNPSDIESIEILKDADATAIYGSKAANGAILITTKKGKAGAMKVDVNIQQGWAQVGHMLDMLNTPQYLAMRRKAFQNDNLTFPSFKTTPTNTDYDVNGVWDTTRNTNWQKALIGNTAHSTNVNASVSGGTSLTQYLVGATYHRETTVQSGDFGDQRAALHFNIHSSSLNQKFYMQLSGEFLADDNQLPRTDLTLAAVTLPPDAPSLYNPDGSINWAPNPSTGNNTWGSAPGQPAAINLKTYEGKTFNIIGSSVLGYHILPGLEVKSTFGYTYLQFNALTLNPVVAIAPESQATYNRLAQFTNGVTNSYSIEPQVTYEHNFGRSQLNALIGSSIEANSVNSNFITGSGFASDELENNIINAGTVTVGNAFNTQYRYNALFGRINYNFDNKYLVNATIRRDGSSRFGDANKFHDFWAIGGGWIFSAENPIKNNVPFLAYGKIRGSYGITGNDQIPDYAYYDLYNSNVVGVPYQGVQSLQPNGFTNPYLQWEVNKKLQLGIDLGFFKDNRILLTVNYIKNRSSNQLLGYNLPSITGFSSITSNFPATVQNSGWEFSLNTTNVKSNTWKWSTSFNLTAEQNKLVDFPNLAASTYNSSLIIGQPLNVTKLYHFLGVDPNTGVYYEANSAGNPTTTPNSNTDRTVLISTFPKYYGGLQNTISFKGFQLDFSFQFVRQIGHDLLYGNGFPGTKLLNQPAFVLQAWQKTPGDNSIYPYYTTNNYSTNSAYSTSLSNFRQSDGYYNYNASYIRLKNASLTYNLPQKLNQKFGVKYSSVILQGQNLLTITKYPGLDPENQTISSLPPLRIITIGIKAGF